MNIRARLGSFPERVITTRAGWRELRAPRTVKRGLSILTVSAPTRIASLCARNFWASRRAAALVIHRPSRLGRVSRPSKVIPHFAVTNGIPVAIHLLKVSFSRAHSSARTPARTSIPALCRISSPRPRCRGFGSVVPITTVFTPERMIASVHAPVRPTDEQGSSVTYKTAAFGTARLNRFRHSISACGKPARRWCPRETIRLPRTRTAPTAGLGLVWPADFFASRNASRMNRSSVFIWTM